MFQPHEFLSSLPIEVSLGLDVAVPGRFFAAYSAIVRSLETFPELATNVFCFK